jgi:gamma-glutamylcyclotransferase (GGCT)/AIG2-like uncharacterized protein YtfP
VYGTLKRLHPNHHLLESKDITDTEFLGRCAITGPFRMLSFRWFPGVQNLSDLTVKTTLFGEVYRVGESTLQALDILEGNGHFFTRTKVETPWKKAWAYFVPSDPSLLKTHEVISPLVWQPTEAEKLFMASGESMQQASDQLAAL